MKEEDSGRRILRLFSNMDAADQLISNDDRIMIEQHDQYVQARMEEVSLLYPNGIPEEIRNSFIKAGYESIPGSSEAMLRFGKITEDLETKGQKTQ